MKRLSVWLLFLYAWPAHAALNVFACEPEWAALAAELGVKNVYSATTAAQDPHRIEARPSLIAKMRNADLVICTGLDLEAGWLPVLLQQSANANVQPGQPGYFEAGMQVTRLDVPARFDRAAGDVHAQGNPHIQHDARNISRIATALAARLAQLDPEEGGNYAARGKAFATRWDAATARWQAAAQPLRGQRAVVNHKSLAYLFNWLGIHEVAALEPKPGVDPSAAHLNAVLDRVRREPVKLVVRTNYEDARAAEWLSERAGVPAVTLASTVGGTPAARDLFALFDDNIKRLLGALQP